MKDNNKTFPITSIKNNLVTNNNDIINKNSTSNLLKDIISINQIETIKKIAYTNIDSKTDIKIPGEFIFQVSSIYVIEKKKDGKTLKLYCTIFSDCIQTTENFYEFLSQANQEIKVNDIVEIYHLKRKYNSKKDTFYITFNIKNVIPFMETDIDADSSNASSKDYNKKENNNNNIKDNGKSTTENQVIKRNRFINERLNKNGNKKLENIKEVNDNSLKNNVNINQLSKLSISSAKTCSNTKEHINENRNNIINSKINIKSSKRNDIITSNYSESIHKINTGIKRVSDSLLKDDHVIEENKNNKSVKVCNHRYAANNINDNTNTICKIDNNEVDSFKNNRLLTKSNNEDNNNLSKSKSKAIYEMILDEIGITNELQLMTTEITKLLNKISTINKERKEINSNNKISNNNITNTTNTSKTNTKFFLNFHMLNESSKDFSLLIRIYSKKLVVSEEKKFTCIFLFLIDSEGDEIELKVKKSRNIIEKYNLNKDPYSNESINSFNREVEQIKEIFNSVKENSVYIVKKINCCFQAPKNIKSFDIVLYGDQHTTFEEVTEFDLIRKIQVTHVLNCSCLKALNSFSNISNDNSDPYNSKFIDCILIVLDEPIKKEIKTHKGDIKTMMEFNAGCSCGYKIKVKIWDNLDFTLGHIILLKNMQLNKFSNTYSLVTFFDSSKILTLENIDTNKDIELSDYTRTQINEFLSYLVEKNFVFQIIKKYGIVFPYNISLNNMNLEISVAIKNELITIAKEIAEIIKNTLNNSNDSVNNSNTINCGDSSNNSRKTNYFNTLISIKQELLSKINFSVDEFTWLFIPETNFNKIKTTYLKNISNINAMASCETLHETNQYQKYRLYGLIDYLVLNQRSIYPACPNCKKKLKTDETGNDYFCLICQENKEPVWTYTLSFKFSDCSGNTFVNLFGDIAEKFLNKPAYEILPDLKDESAGDNRLRNLKNKYEKKRICLIVNMTRQSYNSTIRYQYNVKDFDFFNYREAIDIKLNQLVSLINKINEIDQMNK